MKWDDLKLFLTVYEEGSFSAAARALRLGQPTLSRRVSELENVVGEALFVRHNSGVSLTSAGEKLLPMTQRMAEWANEAQLDLGRRSSSPSGTIKITAPPAIAYDFVVALAAQLRQPYPQLQFEVLARIDTLNLSRGEADISLRTKAPQDDDLICIDSIKVPLRIYCAASYAQQLPLNVSFEELDWICWSSLFQDLEMYQLLKKRIKSFHPSFSSDDYNVQIAACRAGLGVMILPRVAHIFPQQEQLVELSLDQEIDLTGELFVVCHKRHRYIPKVALVLEAISTQFALARQRL